MDIHQHTSSSLQQLQRPHVNGGATEKVPAAPPGSFAESTAGPRPEQSAASSEADLWHRLLRALRGRWWAAVMLGILMGGAGAIAGWKVGRCFFQCEGLIRIASSKPAVIRETDQNGPIAMYDALLRSQQLVLTSRRMLDLALASDEWRKTGLGDSPAVVSMFAANLKVEHPAGTENLRVAFTGEDPQLTAAAVNAMIHAFQTDYKVANHDLQQKRIALLKELATEQRRLLGDLEKRLAALAGQGAVDVDQLRAAAVLRLSQYEMKLSEIELALALSQGGTSTTTVAKTPATMSVDEIAMRDANMQGLVNEQAHLEGTLEQMELRLGENHSSVVGTRRMLERAKRRVSDYAERYRAHLAELAQSPQRLGAATGQSVETLKVSREVVAKLVDQAKQEVSSLASKRDEADTLKAMATKLRLAIAETEDRRAALGLELQLGDRFEVTSWGEVPLTPSRDTRVRYAAAGGLAGACLPAGVIGMLGLLRRKYRYVDEAATEVSGGRRLPLLGVLPVLPRQVKGGERAADAALCVHQVRAKLQSLDGEGPVMYLVSSAAAQEGKTSLCMALGLSYAAAGAQTLLIDADLVGQGLTRGLGAQSSPGLREALESGLIHFREHSRRLFVMPTGKGGAMDACKLSPGAVRRILAKEKERFDVVLVDSGPILGSVEAMVIAPMVDGVIVTVAQGQKPDTVERALRHLEAIGAHLKGFVFNRAGVRDFYKSFQSSSLRDSGPKVEVATAFRAGQHKRMGPIVDSVASFLPASAPEKG